MLAQFTWMKTCQAQLLQRGLRVQLIGLQSQPGLNGRHGILLSFDDAKQAWRLVTTDGKGCVVRVENLHVLPSSLRSSPLQSCQLSPRTDSAVAQESEEDDAVRAVAQPSEEDAVRAATAISNSVVHNAICEIEEDCAVRPGAHVRLNGLSNRADLNGCVGLVLRFHEGRWEVVIGTQIARLLSSNLQVVDVEITDAFVTEHPLNDANLQAQASSVQVGDRVRITGLLDVRSLNGCEGIVVQLIECNSKCKVVLDNGTCKNVKVAALQLVRHGRMYVHSDANKENQWRGPRRSHTPGWDPAKCSRVRSPRAQQTQADYTATSVKEWLSHIDEGHGFLDPYVLPLQEKYGSVANIVDMFSRSGAGIAVQRKFFEDNSVNRLGHQRLFERWFTSFSLNAIHYEFTS